MLIDGDVVVKLIRDRIVGLSGGDQSMGESITNSAIISVLGDIIIDVERLERSVAVEVNEARADECNFLDRFGPFEG